MFTFHHVALSVSDIGRSVAFYEQLGFTQSFRWTAPDSSLSILHLRLGEATLELFCYRNPSPRRGEMETLEGDLQIIGTKHFALKVESISDALQSLIARGVVPENTTITQGRTGLLYFFIRDPDGIFVEIVEDSRSQ